MLSAHSPSALLLLRTALVGALAVPVGAGAPLPAQDRPLATDVLRVQWVVPAAPVYAGQTFELSLDVLLEGDVEGAGLLQLFPQPVELPVQVDGFARVERLQLAPWPDDEAAARVVVDGDVAPADGPFTVEGDPDGVVRYRITRLAQLLRSGAVELPAPTARYAIATEFRDDFVQGRVPVDRIERNARGSAATLEALGLPERGRPLTFDGAVGRFELLAAVEPRSAAVGETLSLRVLVVGATPFHAVPAPQVDAGDWVDILGVTRKDVEGGTEFTYDLVARSIEVKEMPPVTLTAFDPEADPPDYVKHTAPELAVSISPAFTAETFAPVAGRGNTTSGSGPGGSDGFGGSGDAGPGEAEEGKKLLWTPLVLGMILSLAFLSVVRRRMLLARGASDAS